MASLPAYLSPDYSLAPGQSWQPGDFQVGTDVYRKPAAPVVPGAPAPGIMPGTNLTKAAANIESGLDGELPPDVIENLRRHAAEFGLSAGLPGSEFAGYAGLRQLGLTSLDRQDAATKATLPFFKTPADLLAQQRLSLDQQHFNANYAMQNRQQQDADAARQLAMQRQAADRWDANRVDPWSRGGNTPVISGGGSGFPGSGINYGGPPGGGRPTPSATPDYSNDISSFITKYLPGAGSKGLFNFQGGDIGDAPPVDMGSGVTSTDLNDDWQWYD